jgi:hypothetical protein
MYKRVNNDTIKLSNRIEILYFRIEAVKYFRCVYYLLYAFGWLYKYYSNLVNTLSVLLKLTTK